MKQTKQWLYDKFGEEDILDLVRNGLLSDTFSLKFDMQDFHDENVEEISQSCFCYDDMLMKRYEYMNSLNNVINETLLRVANYILMENSLLKKDEEGHEVRNERDINFDKIKEGLDDDLNKTLKLIVEKIRELK